MILPFIYLAFILGWVILLFAYLIDDWPIKGIMSFYFMVLGVNVFINGIEGLDNLAVVAFGAVHVVVGGYIIITESFKLYENM